MSGKEQIIHTIQHLEHILPGQASITDFVHHNTLHGFQKDPFPKALAKARAITGIYGYHSPARFRTFLAQGRITREDLDAVIAADPDLQADQPLGFTTRGLLFRLLMEQEIKPISTTQLAWKITEQEALTRLQPKVNANIRTRFKAAGEAETLTDLWQACLKLFEVQHNDWYREQRLDLSTDEPLHFPQDANHPVDHVAQSGIVAQIRHHVDHLWQTLTDQVGHTMTLGDLLHVLTGDKILEEQRHYLLRYLGAFLDLGVASWSLPDRHLGFYAAWKQCASREWPFVLEEMPTWQNDIDELPDSPLEAVESCLSRMGLPEERWGGYLERLALALPGWSGMMMWRSHRPDYQGIGTQVAMLDYLAVLLVLERLFAVRLCRIHWLVEPSLETLGWYFRHHRAELYVRWSLFNEEVPEFLASRATRLLHRPVNEPNLVGDWQKLAFSIWIGQQNQASHHGARDKAWPLFLMAQHLGMTGDQVRQGGTELADGMMACLEQLDEEKMGYLWLQAYERHYHHQIFAALIANHGRGAWADRITLDKEQLPSAQVIFCMDDREEGIRRHLEEIQPTVETLGAAGFFGVPIHWLGLDETTSAALCPVVVTPAHEIHEIPTPGHESALDRHRNRLRIRLWFKKILYRDSHRGLIHPMMLSLLAAPWTMATLIGKLLAPGLWGVLMQNLRQRFDGSLPTTLTLTAPKHARPATPDQPRLGFTDEEQTGRVAGFLRTIGLTSGFAPLVVIFGHGSSSQNNPHLAAYDCGACSGRHGGPNARVFAAMANRSEVRERLRHLGIDIPETTWFIGAEHDTGNETLTWFDLQLVPESWHSPLRSLTKTLDKARARSAHERTRRLASAPRHPSPSQALAHMVGRGLDWSQARPELGHATNAVALIGRRAVTRGVFFDRRMFLISYDPTQDVDGRIVEAILLAAGPVGAGISLEYYFSTVDNDRFGCGTKVVHNITGLFGVMEGTSSDLRTGLPQQMIEIHEAMRLLVVVEQQTEILTGIYQRQPEIRELVGHGWIILAAMDPKSGVIHQFQPETGWTRWENSQPSLPTVSHSSAWYDGHTGPLPPVLLAQEKNE